MRGLDSFNLWSEPSTSFARHCCSRSQLVQPTGLRPTTGSKQQTWCRAFRDSRSGKSPRRRPGCARAEASDGKDSRDTATQTSKDDRIKQTLAGLDALLGVEEDEGRKKDLEAQKASVEEAQVDSAAYSVFLRLVVATVAANKAWSLSVRPSL